ncbi:hypothetical protein SLS58_007184 [Diplodia intermedia]|uniref:Uncharacterized protein n=1 Tax=Diplodia intermedia TaxID=856260 RepID=A0ABR3TKZ9_9PEZI
MPKVKGYTGAGSLAASSGGGGSGGGGKKPFRGPNNPHAAEKPDDVEKDEWAVVDYWRGKCCRCGKQMHTHNGWHGCHDKCFWCHKRHMRPAKGDVVCEEALKFVSRNFLRRIGGGQTKATSFKQVKDAEERAQNESVKSELYEMKMLNAQSTERGLESRVADLSNQLARANRQIEHANRQVEHANRQIEQDAATIAALRSQVAAWAPRLQRAERIVSDLAQAEDFLREADRLVAEKEAEDGSASLGNVVTTATQPGEDEPAPYLDESDEKSSAEGNEDSDKPDDAAAGEEHHG